jgi:hypothetical protein
MRENISPEEKLLRLIRGQKKPANLPQDAPRLKKSLSLKIPRHPQKILLVILGLSCFYLLVSLIYPWVALKKIKLPAPGSEKIGELKPNLGENAKPLDYYEKEISGRQIFGAAAGQSTAANIANADILKDINLVGIISGESPQAVIEDKKAGRTYYVSKGQFIQDMQVIDIQEGKIILTYRGQNYELHL